MSILTDLVFLVKKRYVSLEHRFSIKYCVKNHSKISKNCSFRTKLRVWEKLFYNLKLHFFYSTYGIRWDNIIPETVSALFSVAFPQLPRDIWTEFCLLFCEPAFFLQCVFVKSSKFVHQLCVKIAFTCSVKVVHSAGCERTSCHAGMCDHVFK